MKKIKIDKRIFQLGLVIVIASVFVSGLFLTKWRNDLPLDNSKASDDYIFDDPCSEEGFVASSWAYPGCKEAKHECDLKGDRCTWSSSGRTRGSGTGCPPDGCVCGGKCVGNNNDKPRRTPTQRPSVTPTSTPTNTPTSTPTLTPTPTPTLTPTPTPTYVPGEPNSCGGTCGSNYNCQGGYFCYNGFCRNPSCASDSDCYCDALPTAPAVLGTSVARVLPKTGGGLTFVAFSSLLGGVGYLIIRRLR